MTDTKCEFCGSKQIIVEQPYVDRTTGKNLTDYCCTAQKKNREYDKKHFHPLFNDR